MNNELHIPQKRFLQIGTSSSTAIKNDNILTTRLSDSKRKLPIFRELNTSGSISQVFFSLLNFIKKIKILQTFLTVKFYFINLNLNILNLYIQKKTTFILIY